MKTKIIGSIFGFFYKWSGVKWVVNEISIKVTNYRLRLNIVPTTYKIFLVALGAVGSFGWSTAYTLYNEQTTYSISVEQPRIIEEAKAEAVAPVEVWSKAEFSAYTASSDETDGSPLVMASGKMVYKGAIACPRGIAFGSVIEVRGGGKFVCEDRMNSRYENHFDIFMLTKTEALQFGRKVMEYRVL